MALFKCRGSIHICNVPSGLIMVTMLFTQGVGVVTFLFLYHIEVLHPFQFFLNLWSKLDWNMTGWMNHWLADGSMLI